MTAIESADGTPPLSWGTLIPSMSRVRIAAVTLLLLCVYWPSIRSHLVGTWLRDGNWSHGWLIPIFSFYFLLTRRDALMNARPRPNYLGAILLAVSLATYFVCAWVLRMGYPRSLSMVGAILGVTLLMGGWGVLRVVYFPILFLLFAIPLPQRVYVDLTMPLRQLTSTMAAAVLPIMSPGLYTEAQAVVIDYTYAMTPEPPPGGGVCRDNLACDDGEVATRDECSGGLCVRTRVGTLNVQEQCSGLRSLMAILTLGVAMAYITERPVWQRVVLVVSCLPIALLCNALRVTVTGLFFVHGRSDLATGTPHAFLGFATYGIALGLYTLVGYVLTHLFVEEPDPGAAAGAA